MTETCERVKSKTCEPHRIYNVARFPANSTKSETCQAIWPLRRWKRDLARLQSFTSVPSITHHLQVSKGDLGLKRTLAAAHCDGTRDRSTCTESMRLLDCLRARSQKFFAWWKTTPFLANRHTQQTSFQPISWFLLVLRPFKEGAKLPVSYVWCVLGAPLIWRQELWAPPPTFTSWGWIDVDSIVCMFFSTHFLWRQRKWAQFWTVPQLFHSNWANYRVAVLCHPQTSSHRNGPLRGSYYVSPCPGFKHDQWSPFRTHRSRSQIYPPGQKLQTGQKAQRQLTHTETTMGSQIWLLCNFHGGHNEVLDKKLPWYPLLFWDMFSGMGIWCSLMSSPEKNWGRTRKICIWLARNHQKQAEISSLSRLCWDNTGIIPKMGVIRSHQAFEPSCCSFTSLHCSTTISSHPATSPVWDHEMRIGPLTNVAGVHWANLRPPNYRPFHLPNAQKRRWEKESATSAW